MTGKQKLMLVGGLGIALGAGVIWLGGDEYFALDHHDEPIVVDNGPLQFDFKSKGELKNPDRYVREHACAMKFLRITVDQNKLDDVTLEYETVKLYVEGPNGTQYAEPIILQRVGPPYADCPPTSDPQVPRFEMVATGFTFEKGGFLGLSSKMIKAKDDLTKGLRIMSVGYYVTEAGQKVEKKIILRSVYGDKPVKVELLTKK